MNPIAKKLNQIITAGNANLMAMFSDIGQNLFFPKGILTQSAEAKEKAHKFNATVGIATENGHTMHLPSMMNAITGITPEDALTYAPSYGLPELRQTWREALHRKNPSIASPEAISLPVVTSGITHGVSVFADIWVKPDDVIILPDMMWGNYNMIFCVRKGARIEQYSLFSESGGFNLDAFEQTVRQQAEDRRKIIVLLNFPHNPSGYSITEAEADRIVEILTRLAEGGINVIAVTDDSYFGLFYETDTLKESIFARLYNQHPRILAVKLDGATKEDFVWGLRVGFITYGNKVESDAEAVYDAIVKKTAGCVRGTISNASRLSQSLLLKAMQSDTYDTEKKAKTEILKARAQCVKRVLADPKYSQAWDVYPFNSGYFMCIRLKKHDAETVRRHLLDKYGVGLIAIGKKNLRVAFSCLDEHQIPELFDILFKGVEDLDK